MSVINTNNLSLVAQRNLNASQNALSTTMQRLSSGLRINSAKDDAAGQAIANRMTANIKGLTQAARNANDGISIAQTTEGSLNEINNNLQRVRELTVQAANGSNSASDLKSIQGEINERLSEINRVSKETQFNGKYILGEDAETLSIQVGANDGQTISINLTRINSDTLGLGGFSVEHAKPQISDAITHVGDASDAPVAPNLSGVATALGVSEDELSLHNVQEDGVATSTYAVKHGDKLYAVDEIAADGAVSLTTADVTITDNTLGTDAVDVELTGIPIQLALDSEGSMTGTVSYQGKSYDVGLDGSEAVTIAADGSSEQQLKSSNNPLAAIDDALQTVDDLRSHLGAIQNRFESTVSNLNNTVSNLSAARSRIEDADYAVEVSNMTRAQILQQAGTTVLSQANQLPQTVLSLLR